MDAVAAWLSPYYLHIKFVHLFFCGYVVLEHVCSVR